MPCSRWVATYSEALMAACPVLRLDAFFRLCQKRRAQHSPVPNELRAVSSVYVRGVQFRYVMSVDVHGKDFPRGTNPWRIPAPNVTPRSHRSRRLRLSRLLSSASKNILQYLIPGSVLQLAIVLSSSLPFRKREIPALYVESQNLSGLKVLYRRPKAGTATVDARQALEAPAGPFGPHAQTPARPRLPRHRTRHAQRPVAAGTGS